MCCDIAVRSFSITFASIVFSYGQIDSRSPFDWGKARRHHQAVPLIDEKSCLVGKLEVRLPFPIRHHGSALARALSRILERPQVHERVDVSALAVQIGEGGS